VFTVQERDHVRDHMLELARNDSRVVAGAEVGSLALGGGDRWSDLDLSFGVADGLALTDVLDDWTRDLISRFDAVHLFDLVADPAIYRVFLLPDYLQLDVTVSPASQFHPTSPRFKLLFGEAARAGLYRTKPMVAGRVRHHTPPLPRDGTRLLATGPARLLRQGIRSVAGQRSRRLEGAIVRSLAPNELIRALNAGIEALLKECKVANDDDRILERLREMAD
jgi:hypothetical protein